MCVGRGLPKGGFKPRNGLLHIGRGIIVLVSVDLYEDWACTPEYSGSVCEREQQPVSQRWQ